MKPNKGLRTDNTRDDGIRKNILREPRIHCQLRDLYVSSMIVTLMTQRERERKKSVLEQQDSGSDFRSPH